MDRAAWWATVHEVLMSIGLEARLLTLKSYPDINYFLTSLQMVRVSHLLPFHQRREQKQRSPGYRRKKPRDPTSSSVFPGKYSGSLDGFPLDNEADLGEEGQALGAATGPRRKDTACLARNKTSHR